MAPAKSKSQKLSLGEFLGDQSLGSWADEMEDMPVAYNRSSYGNERRAFSSASGFGERSSFGGRDRGAFEDRPGFQPRQQLPLPTKPPFTAHLGNLSYDSTEGDIHDFFAECAVTSVRIVEDRQAGRPKGFAYVEFGTLDGLKKALELDNESFQGRTLRISVADPPKDRGEARELTDWTRKGPLPDLPSNQRRASDRPFRNFDSGSDAGGERADRRRPPPFQDDGKVRDFGNWERKGPLSPAPATGPPVREGGRLRSGEIPTRERKPSPNWSEARSNEGSRPPRERPQNERQPTAPEIDNQWRARMKPDAPVSSTPTPEASTPSSPAAPPAPLAPASRPKLNLTKRTVSEADPGPLSASSESKSSIFGGAKPIDTSARDKEIEDKRQQVLKQKKEQEEKIKEEKRSAKENAAKTDKEKGAATPNTPQENGKSSNKNEEKENGAASPREGRNFEILRRVADDNGEADADVVDEPANGTIVEDKEVKPKEIVKDINDNGETNAGATAESLEDDGFSTVTRKTKNNRRGGARALAS
ncbi:MAG: hypothetical protein M1820_002006 [Bogoriella megaspora]|nr:MAG: hypothetical protein M1820_002006 [Bogoriella megaspora]